MSTTTIKYKGDGVVKDFRRLLETGDMAKLTPRLYRALTQDCGFIAHYSREGFAAHFAGRLSALLRGELRPLTDPERLSYPALRDKVYSDGFTADQVVRAMALVARGLEPAICEQEADIERARRIGLAAETCRSYGVSIDSYGVVS